MVLSKLKKKKIFKEQHPVHYEKGSSFPSGLKVQVFIKLYFDLFEKRGLFLK